MWVNKILFETVLTDNKKLNDTCQIELSLRATAEDRLKDAQIQKTKDDAAIDWLRSRVNALEKERTVLLMKAAGIALPTPEIVQTQPRTFDSPKYDMGISFEDVGDEEAARLGIQHEEDGTLVYTK